MGWIILLLLLGALLFFVELVLLPGITVAGVGAFCAFIAAAVLGFVLFESPIWGFLTVFVIVVIVAILTALFLRPKTWKKVTLKAEIKDAFEQKAETVVSEGAEGETLTRLAPMGKVLIDGNTYEAKSLDSFIDPKTPIVVTGFDNSSLIVKTK